MSGPARTEEEITTILMALVAWAGQVTPASNYLKTEKNIAIGPPTLKEWKHRYGDRLDALREKYAGQLEGNLAHEMRDCARLAVETERLALEKVRERLESGKEQDPSRAAANLATVASKNTDKLLSLTGRPTSITQSVDATAILRGLVAKGILLAPEASAEEEPPRLEGPADS